MLSALIVLPAAIASSGAVGGDVPRFPAWWSPDPTGADAPQAVSLSGCAEARWVQRRAVPSAPARHNCFEGDDGRGGRRTATSSEYGDTMELKVATYRPGVQTVVEVVGDIDLATAP